MHNSSTNEALVNTNESSSGCLSTKAIDVKAPLLSLRSVDVTLHTRRGDVAALKNINLDVDYNEGVAIVGESGGGKSTLASTILRLLPVSGKISGRIFLKGTDLLSLDSAEMRRVRGREIGMVFQNPLSALDPLQRIGTQISEVLDVHHLECDRKARVMEILDMVALDVDCAKFFPHQLSGGMRQRAMLAISLAAAPSLLLADEPTAALDPPLRSQLTDLLTGLRDRLSLLIITHDIELAMRLCSRVAVMYAGEIVEKGPCDLLRAPRHPYTSMLIDASRMSDVDFAEAGPDLFDIPSGCAFHPRCPHRLPCCSDASPALYQHGDSWSRCFLNSERNDTRTN